MDTVVTDEIKEVINNLIKICVDGEKGFLAASNSLSAEEPLLKSELMQYSLQRKDFAKDLEHALGELGEKPVTQGSALGPVHRGWTSVKQAMASNIRYSVLVECERGENAALAAYRENLASSLPEPVLRLIGMQYEAVKRVHDRIGMLRDAAKSS